MKMTLLINKLRRYAVTYKLSDPDVVSIAGMFEIKGYKSGEAVVLSKTEDDDYLSILSNGNIKVKVPCGIGA
jgi:hypothetical protein